MKSWGLSLYLLASSLAGTMSVHASEIATLPVPTVEQGCFNERFVQSANIEDRFFVAHALVNISSVMTYVNGNEVSHGWDASTSEIQFSNAGIEGAVLDLRYCLNGYPKEAPVCTDGDCSEAGQ
ncbi:MAG: hypothetical protein ABIR96_10550 [Bdellovibrionota bacterium]